MTTLLLSSRHTADDQALWRAAVREGWQVERARGIRVPEIDDDEIIIYVEALFAPTIAKALNRELLDPPDDWLVRLPEEYRKRNVRLTTLGEARRLDGPEFIKPPNDKSFEAKVYLSGQDLPKEFDDSMSVLVAEPVKWGNEFRCFVLDGAVKTLSPYLRSGEISRLSGYFASPDELTAAREFTNLVVSDSRVELPRAVVVDVGELNGDGWAVVEANGAWGSGIYGCDPDLVLQVIRHASIRRRGAEGHPR